MFLSKSCVYALRAAVYVAAKEHDAFVPIGEIATHLNLSFHFLTKILQTLTKKEIMESFKGPRGGVRLKKPSSTIRLIDIVEAIDGVNVFNKCILGFTDCEGNESCSLHEKWSKVRKQMIEIFETTTLADIDDHVKDFEFKALSHL